MVNVWKAVVVHSEIQYESLCFLVWLWVSKLKDGLPDRQTQTHFYSQFHQKWLFTYVEDGCHDFVSNDAMAVSSNYWIPCSHPRNLQQSGFPGCSGFQGHHFPMFEILLLCIYFPCNPSIQVSHLKGQSLTVLNLSKIPHLCLHWCLYHRHAHPIWYFLTCRLFLQTWGQFPAC